MARMLGLLFLLVIRFVQSRRDRLSENLPCATVGRLAATPSSAKILNFGALKSGGLLSKSQVFQR
jgi:hypothetical protein